MPRLYFGHPINTYDTPLEDILINAIQAKFPDWEIENPNRPHHQHGYREYKRETGNGMNYFFARVLPYCGAGVFLPFPDGRWGHGVFQEALFLGGRGRPVHLITTGELIFPAELHTVPVLSVEETRSRIYGPSGKLVPYC